MKFVLAIYMIVNGVPVEQGRNTPDQAMTQPMCLLGADIAMGHILNRRPDLAGKIQVKCVPVT